MSKVGIFHSPTMDENSVTEVHLTMGVEQQCFQCSYKNTEEITVKVRLYTDRKNVCCEMNMEEEKLQSRYDPHQSLSVNNDCGKR